MYFDSKNQRILLRNGTSITSPFEYARSIIEDKRDQSSKVLESFDSKTYEYMKGIEISAEVEDVDIVPDNLECTDEDIGLLGEILYNSPRYKEEHDDRIMVELEFFIKTNNITFLLKVYDLIQRFKEDKIVWGVGRGSGSASLVLYLLEVHDIDPVKYDISFSELSKEIEYD